MVETALRTIMVDRRNHLCPLRLVAIIYHCFPPPASRLLVLCTNVFFHERVAASSDCLLLSLYDANPYKWKQEICNQNKLAENTGNTRKTRSKNKKTA